MKQPSTAAPSTPVAPQIPRAGGVAEVAPGVLWVRLALPLALDHVNVWLLEDGEGWTLVDTGLSNEGTRDAWAALEREAMGGRPLRRIVCTHYHPDHIGLSGWLASRHGAELWCSRTEWLSARFYSTQPLGEARAVFRRFYRRAGVARREMEPLVEQARTYKQWVPQVPPSHRRLQDGDELEAGRTRWRVVVGRGHAPEHVCLHAPALRLFVSGDQVLLSITPNVSVWPNEPEADPVGDFLQSGAELRSRVPDDVLVLPSHGQPFAGLHARLDALATHHRQRLEEASAACAEPRTAWEVTRALFPRELDPHQSTFAVGEGLAHLNHLVRAGMVRREPREGRPDLFVRADRLAT
ncbi:MAG TPA: MBL fold metallo-hydrolase [Anaeromyxobacteraceae bacterium]|nr:MBL fold metallo-hydrolase [Anaeromyxobacteraceae bacterium]